MISKKHGVTQSKNINMKKRGFAKWKRGERITRFYKMEIPSTPDKIFPLLCPEKEYLWLNNWKCTMVYSDTGYADGDAIFYQNSGFPFYKRLNWYVIDYSPNEKIEFLIVINKVGTIKFSIDIQRIDNKKTELTWTFLITSHGKFGSKIFNKEFALGRFNEDISNREKDLVYWIQNNEIRPGNNN